MSWYNSFDDLGSDVSDALGYTQNGLDSQDIADIDSPELGAKNVPQQRHDSKGSAMATILGGRGGMGGGTGMVQSHGTPAAPFHYQGAADGGAVVKNFFNAADKHEQEILSQGESVFNSLMKMNFQ